MRVMDTKKIALVFLAINLTGCASVNSVVNGMKEGLENAVDGVKLASTNYVEPPETAPHALVRFVSDGHVVIHPNSTCRSSKPKGSGVVVNNISMSLGAKGLPNQKRGMTSAPPNNGKYTEVRVPSDVPVTIMSITAVSDKYSCRIGRYFVLAKGAEYTITDVADIEAKKCALLVYKEKPESEIIKTQEATYCKE
jgi:hypothetical protein